MLDARLAWRRVLRSKFLYILMVVTMTLSVLTVLMAFTFRDTALELRLNQLRAQTLNTQLAVVTRDAEQPTFLSADATAAKSQPNVAHTIERFVAPGTIKGKQISVLGLDLKSQQQALPFPVTRASARGFDAGLIVSESFASAHGVSIDEAVEITTPRGRLATFVSSVCRDTGLLGSPERAAIELGALQRLYGKGSVTSIGLTLVDLSAVQRTKNDLESKLPVTLVVEQRYDTAGYESYVGSVQLALSIFSFFSVVMSIFMTTSILQRLLEARRLEMGTQRSLGTPKRRLLRQILLESWFVLGIALIAALLAYTPALTVLFHFIGTEAGPVHVAPLPIVGVLVGFLVAVTAVGVLTVRGVLATPVIGLLKGEEGAGPRRFGRARLAAGVALLAVVVALYVLDRSMLVTAAAMPLLLIALVLLLPWIHAGGVLLARLVVRGRRFEVPLTEMGRRFRDYGASLLLITLVMSVLSVGLQVTQSLRDSVNDVYGKSDAMIDSWGEDLTSAICTQDPDAAKCVRQIRFSIVSGSDRLQVAGIDGDYAGIASENSRVGITKSLEALALEANGILVTSTWAKSRGIAVGGDVELPGIGHRRVVGVIDSIEESGMVQFVNMASVLAVEGFGKDYKLFVQYKPGVDVAAKTAALREKYSAQPFNAQSLVQMRAENAESTAQIFRVIWWLFGFTFVVGLITLVNNLWVGAFRRKSEVATKLSLGLPKGDFLRERVLVGLLLGLIGGLAGVASGVGMTYLVVRLMNYFVGSARVSYDLPSLVVMLGGSLLVCVLASAIPARSLVQRPLITSIKGRD